MGIKCESIGIYMTIKFGENRIKNNVIKMIMAQYSNLLINYSIVNS